MVYHHLLKIAPLPLVLLSKNIGWIILLLRFAICLVVHNCDSESTRALHQCSWSLRVNTVWSQFLFYVPKELALRPTINKYDMTTIFKKTCVSPQPTGEDIPAFAISYRMIACRLCPGYWGSAPTRSLLPLECNQENRRCYYMPPPSSSYQPPNPPSYSEDAQFLDKLALCPRECITTNTGIASSSAIFYSVCVVVVVRHPFGERYRRVIISIK